MTKKELAVQLSKLLPMSNPDFHLEQYSTECEIAAQVLWFANMNNEIKGEVVADFGCGNGILGIGALLLGARKVYFLDIDKEAIEITKKNLNALKLKKYELINQDISAFKEKVNIVIQNPPFGVQNAHIDRIFLQTAFKCSELIYSFHKIESKEFIKQFTEGHHFNVKAILKFALPLKKTQPFHNKEKYNVEVGCWKIEKLKNQV